MVLHNWVIRHSTQPLSIFKPAVCVMLAPQKATCRQCPGNLAHLKGKYYVASPAWNMGNGC